VTGALYLDFVHPDVSYSFSQVSTGIARVEPPNSSDEDNDDSGDELKSDNNEVKVTKKKAKNATSKEHE
jgi:hypothetical protein